MKALRLWAALFTLCALCLTHNAEAADSKTKPAATAQPKAPKGKGGKEEKKPGKPGKAKPSTVQKRPSILADPSAWAAHQRPTKPPARVIGGYAQGCIAGAVALPLEGGGYQVLRTARNRYYGHPTLVSYIQKLARQAQKASLPEFLIGDMGQPRGGPMAFGHASHQNGLDVDIWFRLIKARLPKAEQERPRPVTMIDPVNRASDQSSWTTDHARLLRIAASFPEVDRIFVNPVIKHTLCASERGDRRWLVKLRPWRGHDEHFHVRLRCPPGSPECVAQTPIVFGDEGCGEELDRWLSGTDPLTFDDSETTAVSAPRLPGAPPPRTSRVPPAECMKVLHGK